jgi:hypothetical protein
MLYKGYFKRIDESVAEAGRFGKDFITVQRNAVALDTNFWSSSEIPLRRINLVSNNFMNLVAMLSEASAMYNFRTTQLGTRRTYDE